MSKEEPRKEIEDAIAEGDLEKLLLICGSLHGHFCPGSSMGVMAAATAVKEMETRSIGMEDVIAIVETNSCFADGVQMVTGCSLGNNELIYRDYGKTAVTLSKRNGEAVRVAAKAGSSPLMRYPEAQELFNKVIRDRKGTEEENAQLTKLWIDISFDMLKTPIEELFTVERVTAEVPEYARIFGSVICSECGESIMETRARVKDGKYICLPCSGDSYYQLGGNGLSLINR